MSINSVCVSACSTPANSNAGQGMTQYDGGGIHHFIHAGEIKYFISHTSDLLFDLTNTSRPSCVL